MELALGDVRVLDLTHHIAGPSCTKLLADFGADVLKIERPEGDPARNMGPFFHDEPHPEKSGWFLHLNTNKRSITLNLKSPLGAAILKELAKRADVLVENFRPGTMERLGLGHEALRAVNPRLVMTSLSNYGQTGPYRDYAGTDLTLFAWGGPMYSNTRDERYPLRLPGEATQVHAGYMAATATLIGLFGRNGAGRHIDISIFETQAASVDRRLTMHLAFQYHGYIFPKSDARGQGFPCGVYPCKDGFVNVWGGMQFFPLSARMIGHPELASDPYWAQRESQLNAERHDEFDARHFLPWLVEQTKLEFLAAARKAGILSGAVFTIEDLVKDPHFKARQFFTPADHPMTGPVRYTGPIVKMPETPARIRSTAPLLGQHNEAVYCGELGFSHTELAQLRRMGAV